MKVEDILRSKGDEVHAISESASVKEAIELLGDRNIGAVIVKGGSGEVVGIFSERDVVRRLRSDGPSALARAVADCMTKDPLTCTLETSIDELMSQMTERRIRHIPVCERGRLLGIVSIGDVVKRKIDDAERETAALKEYISS